MAMSSPVKLRAITVANRILFGPDTTNPNKPHLVKTMHRNVSFEHLNTNLNDIPSFYPQIELHLIGHTCKYISFYLLSNSTIKNI